MNLLGNQNSNAPSLLKDPFLKDCITGISIYYTTLFSKEWSASISFKNGNTEGKFSTKKYGPDKFEACIKECKELIKSLS